METKIVKIEGTEHKIPADAVYYSNSNKGNLMVYKILNDQVFVASPTIAWEIEQDLKWIISVISPEEIIDSEKYKLLPGLSSKKTLRQQLKERQEEPIQSWEEHPVHKEDQKKIPVHYCPPVAIEGIGQVLYNSTAIKKREPWNWREGQIDLMGYLGKAQRHILATIDKKDQDDLDPEINTHHLDCAMANIALIRDAMKHGTLVDNRPVSNLNKKFD